MNWKLIYKNVATGESTSKIFPSKLTDLTEQHHTIWDSLADGYLFLPSMVGLEKQPDSTARNWAQLCCIVYTEETADLDAPNLEDIALLFDSQKGRFANLANELNTEITFTYRDANNYHVDTTVVLQGAASMEQRRIILISLDEGEFFIPDMVGLTGKRFESETEADHPWFTLYNDDFSYTANEPTVDMTIAELVEKFQQAKANNWGQPQMA